MKLASWLLCCLCIVAPHVCASERGALTAQVKAFSKACLVAFERRDWRSGLSCVAPQTLQQLKDKYLDTHVLPSYKTIPVELQAAFGKRVTREQLAAMARC